MFPHDKRVGFDQAVPRLDHILEAYERLPQLGLTERDIDRNIQVNRDGILNRKLKIEIDIERCTGRKYDSCVACMQSEARRDNIDLDTSNVSRL